MFILMTTLEYTIIYQIIDVERKTWIKDIASVAVVDLFIKMKIKTMHRKINFILL